AVSCGSRGFHRRHPGPGRLPRREDRFAARLVARLHADSGCDGAAYAARVADARGGLFVARLSQTAPGAQESAIVAIRTGGEQTARARARTVGTAHPGLRRTGAHGQRADSHLGPPTSARARARAAAG